MTNDEAHRWTVWDLFLRTGTAELTDARIPGVQIAPSPAPRRVGAARLAVGRLVRFGLGPLGPEGRNPLEMIAANVGPGDVLAISAEEAGFAVMGSRLAARAVVQGAGAVVTDGSLRDLGDLARMPLGAWAGSASPSGGEGPGSYVRLDGPSKLFGLEWQEGDWYAQDEDGALRITPTALEELVRRYGKEFKK
jgi:hypothetical protein